jgi:hypothetical protein
MLWTSGYFDCAAFRQYRDASFRDVEAACAAKVSAFVLIAPTRAAVSRIVRGMGVNRLRARNGRDRQHVAPGIAARKPAARPAHAVLRAVRYPTGTASLRLPWPLCGEAMRREVASLLDR